MNNPLAGIVGYADMYLSGYDVDVDTCMKTIQQAANTISIPGNQLVVPWVGIKFSTKGEEVGQNVLGGGLIGQYQKQKDGKIGLEVVYPFDIATAPMVYPFPGY